MKAKYIIYEIKKIRHRNKLGEKSNFLHKRLFAYYAIKLLKCLLTKYYHYVNLIHKHLRRLKKTAARRPFFILGWS